jgi:hypothetical protein
MATENVGFNVTVNGVERTITSFKDLKKATKDLRDEQLAMSAKFGDTSEQATKAGKKLAELKDKVEDLNDSTQSLKGSGVEKLTSSFRLLGEGIGTFDFDKIKTGFKGVGAAMSAIPIFLIIEGLKLLYDNFDKITAMFDTTTASEKALAEATKEVSGELAKVLEGVQKVESGFAAFHEGTITRDEALKIYNETLGSTLGTTNDLAVAEKNFAANKDLYIEAMQAKITANVLFTKSAEAQAKVLTGEAEETSLYQKAKAFGLQQLTGGIISYSAKLKEYSAENVETTKKEAQEITKSAQKLLEESDKKTALLKKNGEQAGLVSEEAAKAAEEKAKKNREKAEQASKEAREKRIADEKKLLQDIANAEDESYIKSLKSEQTQSIAKAQFQNDKLIEDINKSTASKATKDKALIQAEITLQENYVQIQKDYKVKQDAIEKTAADKKAADKKTADEKEKADAIKVLQTKLSIIESGYQLELEKDKTKNSIKLQNVEKGSEEEKAILENADQEKLIKVKAHLKEIYDINIANAKLLNLDTTNLTNKYLQEKEALENAARDKKTEADKKAEADEKARKTQLQKDIFDSVVIAAQTSLAVSKTLSDTYYMKESQKNNKLYTDKLKNVRQGSKEEKAILEQKAKDEKDLARQQFETQKKFNRASAIINGLVGIGALFMVPDPTFGILTAIRVAALIATTAANVAQINSTAFDEGGASGGAIPAATDAPTTSQAPAIYGPGQGQSTTFSGNQNNNFAPVKAYVVETENRSTTNRVNKLVSESTYG